MEKTSFMETIRDVARQQESALSHHPPEEELIDYIDDLLPEARAEAIREHLALCSHCTGVLLYLEEPLDLLESLHASAPIPFTSKKAEQVKRETLFTFGAHPAFAAALVLLSLGLFGWGYSQYKGRLSLLEPTIAIQVSDLFPVDRVERIAIDSPAPTLQVLPGTRHIILFLITTADASYSDIGVKILNGDSQAMWESRVLPLNGREEISLTIPREFLPTGDYRILLNGLEKGAPVLEEEYQLHVE